jgi:hypothetical protein
MKPTNGFEYTLTWPLADARQAGVIKSGSGWEKHEAKMLRWPTVEHAEVRTR